ncbi:MAG: riboflavin synthase [Sedimentisphaerales bacterium]|nr:riboflavin synthase [Sedimentisphaerales bacterium]
MFTGIIESIGTVKGIRQGSGGKVISVDLGKLCDDIKHGDSVAVNGVCLTVSKISGTAIEFNVSAETLSRSSINNLTVSAKVNLERAMSAEGRFGGHIVQGHIDGVATVSSIERKGAFSEMVFSAGKELLDEMVVKGSVAIDGISLTVSKMDERSFGISVIPTTLQETTLGTAKIGDIVNIETDILIKAVKKQLKKILPEKGGLTESKLKEYGF